MAYHTSSNSENYHRLLPFLAPKLQGDQKQQAVSSIVFSYFTSHIPSPISLCHDAISYGLMNYYSKLNHETQKLMSSLTKLDDQSLQATLLDIYRVINHQIHLTAVSLHTHNDRLPIFANPRNPEQAVFIPDKVVDAKGLKIFKEQPKVKEQLLNQVNAFLALSPQEQYEWLDSYSHVRIITHQDCLQDMLPLEMVGQNGVFASQNIPAHSMIGFYTGLYLQNTQEATFISSKNPHGFKAYVFSLPGQEYPVTSGYQYGNRVTVINSATNYTGNASEIGHVLYQNLNMVPVCFKTNNNPDPQIRDNPDLFDINGYVSIREIKIDEQFYVDYGYEYWKDKNTNFTSATEDEIMQVYDGLKATQKKI